VSGDTISVAINRAATDGTVVDYEAAPLEVLAGTGGTTITLDMAGADGELLRASGNLAVDVAGFFRVQGGFAVEKSSEQVTLSDGATADVDLLTIGATGVDAFAGLNGGTADALGLTLEGTNFALAMLTDQTDTTRKWLSLEAEVGSVAFVGIEGLTVSGDTISVQINQTATDGTVVDYASQNLVVTTGPDASLTLTMDGAKGELIRASGNLDLRVFGFFSVQGGFAFEKSTATVTLSDGAEATVTLVTLGGGAGGCVRARAHWGELCAGPDDGPSGCDAEVDVASDDDGSSAGWRRLVRRD